MLASGDVDAPRILLPTGGLLRGAASIGEFPQDVQRLLDVPGQGDRRLAASLAIWQDRRAGIALIGAEGRPVIDHSGGAMPWYMYSLPTSFSLVGLYLCIKWLTSETTDEGETG
ncbi:MAG: hypothetical protein A3K12_05510 [Candidatus Rokubacteria bacterium RIFCSPLOWO2_12_FULL_71_19]|nr:MAG: hypothetical protein A3K12_05510 [Candidatus Rokubacteria bacterium RIFCSPLOWO2_12_FULL_71_19]